MGVIQLERQERVCLQVIPDGPVCNECAYEIAEMAAGLYRSPMQRLYLSRKGICFESKSIVTWEAIFTCDSVSYFITCPRRLAEIFKIRVETSLQNVLVKYVPFPLVLDELQAVGAELIYKRKDIFSLDIDESCQLMPDLAATMKVLSGKDRVVIQAIFDPVDTYKWQSIANESYFRFIRGAFSKAAQLDKQIAVDSLDRVLSKIGNVVRNLLGRPKGISSYGNLQKTERAKRLLKVRKLSDPHKPSSKVIRVFLRVAAESRNQARAVGIVHSFTDTYKRLSADNELGSCYIKRFRNSFIKNINNRQLPLIKTNGNIMSVKECGKLMCVSEK